MMDSARELFKQLTPDTLILTANKRLSAWLQREYATYQAALGKQAWHSLKALPIQTWMQTCWETAQVQNLTQPLMLLSEHQSRLLWQEIITQHSPNPLLHISGTIKNAQQAWQLLKNWQLSLEDPALLATSDSRQFIAWGKIYAAICHEEQFTDFESLPDLILQLLKNKKLSPPKHILALGFLEVTPAIQQLFETLEVLGCKLEKQALTSSNTQVNTIALKDELTEITTMARWAKQLYDQHQKTRVACIIPSLNDLRKTVDYIFNDVFEDDIAAFNISSGQPLSEEPIIEIALAILRLPMGEISVNQLGYLLRSPFLIDAEKEISQRALLDAEIRDSGNIAYTLNQLTALIPEEDYESLAKGLKKISNENRLKKSSPDKWHKIFIERLQQLGWPGERSLNSREYQATQHLMLLFDTFNSLITIKKSMAQAEALHCFTQLAQHTLFQPKTEMAPIQILGMLEANDMLFEHTWVMGLSDQQWPQSARPNPLLPTSFQRHYNMPHASSKRELLFSKLMTKQLIATSPSVILSHAIQTDVCLQEASPLINNYNKIKMKDLSLTAFKQKELTLLNSEKLQHLIDDQGPSVTQQKEIRGGTTIFKQQAACPFQAFAKLRLNSESLSEPEIGLDALDRGLLAHKVLEIFWQKTKSYNNLIALTDEKLHSLIKQCIHIAFHAALKDRHIATEFLNIEKERLLQIMLKWLAIEKQRKPFTVVAKEQWQQIAFGKFSIRMKVDRMDQLDDKNYLLIDYKTGRTHISQWFGDRPDEPQLPLYAISAKKQITAIAFGQLRTDNICFKGAGVQANEFLHIKPIEDIDYEGAQSSWEKQLTQWEKTLAALFNEFTEGNAAVNPKDPNRSCRYCDLQTLCRIYENN